jgi:uncharacterized protein with ParB-like and HNH nuclease domain
MDYDQGVLGKHLAFQMQQYRIPEFQRPYSWTKRDWETLLIDVLRQYAEVQRGWTNDEDVEASTAHLVAVPTHYIGTIVTANPVTVTPPYSTVVDGQQRLLTGWIILLAIRDVYLKRLGTSAANRPSVDAVKARFAPYLYNIGMPGRDLFRVLPQGADERAYDILASEDRKPGNVNTDSLGFTTADSSLLIDAFNYFRREFARSRIAPSAPYQLEGYGTLYPLQPRMLEYTVLNRLFAIKLVASGTDDPNMIFESLNTKGRDLQQVDLIKNFLYLALGAEASTVYRRHWRPMEGVLDPNELERFAWAWEVSMGENVLQKRTYESVQRRLRNRSSHEVKDYVAALHTQSVWFDKLIRSAHETDPSIRRAIKNVNAAGGSTALPLLLYCYRQHQEELASLDDLIKAFGVVESFLIRRMLAGRSTQVLNPIFGVTCNRLNDAALSLSRLLPDRVRQVLSMRSEEWPDDSAVLAGIKGDDFYHRQNALQRVHILKGLDAHYNSRGVALEYEESDKSIEHIVPQDRNAPWWSEHIPGTEVDEVYRRKDALCNLTLLTPSENSRLGNEGWPAKRRAYASCGYPMTQRIPELFDESAWSVGQLDIRAGDLLEAVQVLWPRELLGVAVAAAAPTASSDPEDDVDYVRDVLLEEADVAETQ